jgi:hypothetical protein
MTDFHPDFIPGFILTLILGIFVCIELGYLYGLREKRLHPELANSASGPIEASIFALLGLLLAFTFNSAQNRMDQRRQLIIQESNDISTAYLRLDLLPEPARSELRQTFREYVDSRLAIYRALPNLAKAKEELIKSKAIQQKIWSGALAALPLDTDPSATTVVIPALNNMIDITTTRTATAMVHTPATIFGLLFVVGLMCATVAGYGMSKSPGRNWFHRLVFVVVVTTTVFVIMDLEFPRRGLIQINAMDHFLIELRQSMGN